MASDDRDVVGACPVDCPDTCAWTVTVRSGEPVRLRASTDHPYTAGQLCVKLNGYLQHRVHPDRLLHPLRRTGPKGSGRFEQVSWDDALGEIAERWLDILRRRGGSAIWPYWSTGTLGQVQGYNVGARLWNVLNTAQHMSTICTRAGVVATVEMLGRAGGHDPERIGEAAAVVLWATNPPVSGHHLWPVVERARTNGAPIVVIDPVRTLAAQRADLYLAPRPGSDAALAHTVANALIAGGRYDEDWVERHTDGFDDYARFVSDWTIDRATLETGLRAAEIEALVEVIGTHRPTALRIGVGVQRHAGGGSAVQALTALGLITGDLRQPGGGPLYVTTGMFPWNEAAVQRPDLRTMPGPQLASTRLGTHLAERGPDGPLVEALWVMNANPAASNPDQRAVRAGLGRDDLFTVVTDHFLTDTADFADLVLPASMQPEHEDIHGSYGQLFVTRNRKAVEPPGECLANSEIVRRLARALGVDEPAVHASDEELIAAALSGGHPAFDGVADTVERQGWSRLNVPAAPFADGFPTPDGRARLWPIATASSLEREGGTGLRLLAVPGRHFVNTLFANSTAHRARRGELTISLHTDDAAARGITEGAIVRIANARGSFTARATVGDGVRPGVVAMPKGSWPKLEGGVTANWTTREGDADFGRGAVFHDNVVEVCPA